MMVTRRVSGTVWDARGGGLLGIGSSYARMLARAERIQKFKGDDLRNRPRFEQPEQPETPEHVEGQRYTRKQLEYMADEILRREGKDNREAPMILLPEHLKPRLKREIYVASGIPDPSIESGLYWRVHPQGRKVNPEARRGKNGFYR